MSNPATDKITVKNIVNIPVNVEISLLNALGRQLEVQHKLSYSNNFDLEKLGCGMYYIAIIHQGEQLEIKRFIKKP
ncbi:MAG: T9SS type A sorting domain-containing protein [Bacteroidetes bacterium]|nr:T9SS type A sorting domain-containing protein [Bacteroidota bacterium]